MCSAPVCHFPTFDVISVGSCDLHALDTPPAFILSQDQTLSRTSSPKTGYLILYRRCNHTEDNFFVITGFYFWLDSVVNDQVAAFYMSWETLSRAGLWVDWG